MAASSKYQICLSVLFCASSILISTTSCYGYLEQSDEQQVALFIFGDSIYDSGNNNYINTSAGFQANYPPYGQTFFGYPTGRFSDGRLIPDFIAGYAKLPLIPPYLQPGKHHFEHGVNFASAGAGALVATYGGSVIDLKTQQKNFKHVEMMLRNKVGGAQAKKMLSRAVYMFCIGSNDYAYALITNSTYSRPQLVGSVIGNITAVIKKIYKQGGRKFGILGLPPIGCFPSTKAIVGGCLEEATMLIKLHNRSLLKVLQILESKLKGFVYSYTDFYTSLEDRMNNPSKYGFMEGYSACCGSGSYRGISSCGGKEAVKEFKLCEKPRHYVFFDSEHPSEKTNLQVAELMWSGPPNVTMPNNLEALFQHDYQLPNFVE